MSGECRWWQDLDTTGALCTHLWYCRAFSASRNHSCCVWGHLCPVVLRFFRRRFTSNNCNWIVERTSVLQHVHAALPSKQRSIQPFVGRWAEPSEFPSPANCPWISFGISKRHQWTSKAFLYRRDTKMRLCGDESILIITPPEPHFPSVYTLTCQVLLSRKQSLPEVGVCAKSARRCCLMWAASDDDGGFSFITNERNWPLTSYYYVIT